MIILNKEVKMDNKEPEVNLTEKLLYLEMKLNEAKVALSNELISEKEYNKALADFHEEYSKARFLSRGAE